MDRDLEQMQEFMTLMGYQVSCGVGETQESKLVGRKGSKIIIVNLNQESDEGSQ